MPLNIQNVMHGCVEETRCTKNPHTQQIRDDRMSRGLKYTQDNKRMGNRRERSWNKYGLRAGKAKLNTLNTG